MWASMFSAPRHNIVSDVVRLIRDCLALANDFLFMPLLTAIVNCMDSLLQDNDAQQAPELSA